MADIAHDDIGRKYATKEEADAAIKRLNVEMTEVLERYGVHSTFTIYNLILEDGSIAIGGTLLGCGLHVALGASKGIIDFFNDGDLAIFMEDVQKRLIGRVGKTLIEQALAAKEAKTFPETLTEEQKKLLNMQVPGEPKWQN